MAEQDEREGLVEEIAGVLTEHVEQADGLFCSCQPEDMHGRLPLATTWETHLADALANLLVARDRRVRSEAWAEGYTQAGYDLGPYQYRETPNPYRDEETP